MGQYNERTQLERLLMAQKRVNDNSKTAGKVVRQLLGKEPHSIKDIQGVDVPLPNETQGAD